MGLKNIFSVICCCCLWLCGGDGADLKDMWIEKDVQKREKLQDVMQSYVDKLPKKQFDAFDLDPKAQTADPVLKFYDQAIERLIKDIPATRVRSGTVVIWYLYNMGFVIKTPNVCFAIDIHHRHARKLEPFLDFIAVTHNHSDHYSLPLLRQLSAARKPVISNFYPNFGYTKAQNFTHEIKGIRIHCSEADHNKRLKKFTMPMEFVCPTGNKRFVFFTSGDCCSHKFLNKKSDRIHVYALHPRCGMSSIAAARKLDPDLTIIGHLQELAHEINVYRWKFSDGRIELGKFKQEKRKAYVPVWGEKFIWDGEKLMGCQK